MGICNTCYPKRCKCASTIEHTSISSETAGKDGLDAKAIAIRSGKLRPGASDEEFLKLITGPASPEGGVYSNTEW